VANVLLFLTYMPYFVCCWVCRIAKYVPGTVHCVSIESAMIFPACDCRDIEKSYKKFCHYPVFRSCRNCENSFSEYFLKMFASII